MFEVWLIRHILCVGLCYCWYLLKWVVFTSLDVGDKNDVIEYFCLGIVFWRDQRTRTSLSRKKSFSHLVFSDWYMLNPLCIKIPNDSYVFISLYAEEWTFNLFRSPSRAHFLLELNPLQIMIWNSLLSVVARVILLRVDSTFLAWISTP